MMKFVTLSIAALVAGWVFAGSATSANAFHHRPGCSACGPVAPVYNYRTIHPARFYTQYHDVSVTRRVNRIRRIYNVTRVQPIIHIHDVTRVHHHTLVQTRNAYENVTRYLSPIRYVERSVQHSYDCGCSP